MNEFSDAPKGSELGSVSQGADISPARNTKLADFPGTPINADYLQQVESDKALLPDGVVEILAANNVTPRHFIVDIRTLNLHINPVSGKRQTRGEESKSFPTPDGGTGTLLTKRYDYILLSLSGPSLMLPRPDKSYSSRSWVDLTPIEYFAYRTNINPATGNPDRRNPTTPIPLPEGSVPFAFKVERGQVPENVANYLAAIAAVFGRLDSPARRQLQSLL